MIDLTADFLAVSDLLQTVTFYVRYDDQNFDSGTSCSAQRVKDNRAAIGGVTGGDDDLAIYDGVWLLAASQVTTPKRGDKIIESSGAIWIVAKVDQNSGAIATYRCYCNRIPASLPPINTVAPAISFLGLGSYSATPGTWLRGTTYAYQWLIGNVPFTIGDPATYTEAPGATGLGYVPLTAPASLMFRVTVTNSGGTTVKYSAPYRPGL